MNGTNTIVDYLTSVPAWYLATCEGDQPHVRPFSFAAVQDGRIWFCTATTKDVYRELEANPKFELTAWKPGSGWVIMRGKAVLKDEAVADHARHAEAAGDVRGDLLEAARDDVGGETVPREKVDEVKGAGRRNGPLDGVGHDLGARSRECGYALAQRLVKRNQPFHRPAGDSGDPFARTREGGHLVDALALNERRVHVEAGDAKAPEGKIGRQEQDVDGALFGHGRKPRREALRAHARKTDEAGSDELRPEVEAVCKSVDRTVVARKKHVVHRFSSFNQSSSSVRAPSGRPRSGVQPSLLMRWAQVT